MGGVHLVGAGLRQVADPAALNVVGISEALGGLWRIRGVYRALLDEVEAKKPGAALLLDLPDFNLRLARALKQRGVPVLYYIAPQAWAWRKGRVKQLRARVRKLCVVFPFEETFFREHGVAAEFVGHPLTEEPIPAVPPVARVALVPGSRSREVERLLPAMAGAAARLRQRLGPLEFVLPIAPTIQEEQVRGILAQAGIQARLVRGGAMEAFRGARLGLVASGTASLEGALAGVPMVVMYRVSQFTYAIARTLSHLSHVCIVNILAGREVVPELLQGAVTPEGIADRAVGLYQEGPARVSALSDLARVKASLGEGNPSGRVSEILDNILL